MARVTWVEHYAALLWQVTDDTFAVASPASPDAHARVIAAFHHARNLETERVEALERSDRVDRLSQAFRKKYDLL